ncbi:MAG TPA: hypothetical protein VFG20_13315 [Planctomycetaceae bacterium]|nr:hypothetical protein [Planctomycetaceae bacterium]
MIRLLSAMALLLITSSYSHAEQITLEFEGTIESVVDASEFGLPPIDFTPMPIGSLFSGTYTYDSESPLTNGGTGFKRYVDDFSLSSSVNINGFEFASTGAGGAIVVSQEANFGYSGIALVTQPISLPEGWSVANGNLPYFTIRFEDDPIQSRPLDLPTNEDGFPTGNMLLILDFQGPVTVGAETFNGRVFINGKITSRSVTGPVPPPAEVEIDVDPTTASNKVNLNTKNPKPLKVAVFGTPTFHVADVVPSSIELGDPEVGPDLKVAPTNIQVVDVDRDGFADLLLSFNLTTLENVGAIDYSTTSLKLTALLTNQGVIFGSDAITIPGAKGKAKK